MATPDASQKTKRRRSYQLASVRQSVSGGVEAARGQLEDEFRILDKEEREKLLYHSDFAVELTTEDSLAMKANPALPWNKLRIMRR